MFTVQYKSFLNFFRFYGILPLPGKSAKNLFSLLWLSVSPVYVWWGVEIDMISVHWIDNLVDIMYFANYQLMFLTEIIVLLLSIFYRSVHAEIFKLFSEIDIEIGKFTKIGYDSSRSINGTRIGFLIFYTICSMSVIIFYYIDNTEYVMEWLPTMIVSHMIHVKVLSFCFFVEMLSERLTYLQKVLNKHAKNIEIQRKLLQIHDDIYHTSRLIHRSHGLLITLVIAVYSCSSLNGLYNLFLKLSNLHPEYGYLDVCYGTMSDGLMIFVICQTSSKLEKTNKTFIGEVNNLNSRNRSVFFETFSIKVMRHKINMNGHGTLHLCNSLIVEVLSLTIPFFIFIIQFEIFFDGY